MAVIALSLTYSPEPELGARDLLKFAAAYCAFLLVVADRPEPARLLKLLTAIVAGAIVPIAFGLYQVATATTEVNVFYGWARVQSIFDHPNTYGFYLVTILGASWALRQHARPGARRLATIVALGAFASAALTLSRNTYAAAALLILVIGVRQRRVLIMAAAATLGIILVAPQVLARGSQFLTPAEETGGNSLVGRLSIWEEGRAIWRTQPVLGRGWGATAVEVGRAPHNDYLRSLVEGGAIGLLCFVAVVWALLKLARRVSWGRVDAPRALLGLALGYALVSFASNTLGKGVYQFHFWLVVAILWVWSKSVRPDGSLVDAEDRAPPPPLDRARS
jgi:putative inorganic carbon (HCO3(-)) transporter